MESKLSISPEKLCEGLTDEFVSLLNYARQLEFEESPDYKSIKLMFLNSITKNGGVMNWEFDWDKRKSEDIKKKDEKSQKSEKSKKDEKINI